MECKTIKIVDYSIKLELKLDSTVFFSFSRAGEAPGSQGIADQQVVIRYFWNYAKDWGGDRNKISLFGESSGAVSIGLHLLSDAVQYISGVILNSATTLARWGVQSTEKALNRAEILARKLGCWSNDNKKMLRCLRSKPAKDYLDHMFDVQKYYFEPPFGPTIDGHILKKDPREILNSGNFRRIPMIVGNTKDEGMYFFIYGFPEAFKKLNNTHSMNSSDYFFYLREIVKSVSERYYKARFFTIHENISFYFKRILTMHSSFDHSFSFLLSVSLYYHKKEIYSRKKVKKLFKNIVHFHEK